LPMQSHGWQEKTRERALQGVSEAFVRDGVECRGMSRNALVHGVRAGAFKRILEDSMQEHSRTFLRIAGKNEP
jgi:hypothetical protein